VSFGPISQAFPFLYPLADRYLYFISPGLIGGALLAAREALERLAPAGERRRQASWVAVASGVAICAFFAAHSQQRAGIWRYSATLVADAARNYPNGVSANLIRAKQAARIRDVDGAVTALRAAWERGFNRFEKIYNDPGFDPVRQHPEFQAVVDEMAARWIAKVEAREDPTQAELRMSAHAHIARHEYGEAHRMLMRALAHGGAYDAEIRNDLDQLARVLDERRCGCCAGRVSCQRKVQRSTAVLLTSATVNDVTKHARGTTVQAATALKSAQAQSAGTAMRGRSASATPPQTAVDDRSHGTDHSPTSPKAPAGGASAIFWGSRVRHPSKIRRIPAEIPEIRRPGADPRKWTTTALRRISTCPSLRTLLVKRR